MRRVFRADVARSSIAWRCWLCRARDRDKRGESVMKVLRQILCHVIGDAFFRGDVYDAELILADTIANPVKSHESHIDCLAALLLDGGGGRLSEI